MPSTIFRSMEILESVDEVTPFSVLGQGSYGEVVRCRCERSSAEVAVKVTRSERAYRLAADKEVVALQLMQGSPYAVQYIRHYQFCGALHIVCELIPRTLHEQMRLLYDARRAFSIGDVNDKRWIEFIRRTIYACCAALAELHSKGFMHMDVKPDNLMVRDTSELGSPVLIDFGSVRRISENNYFNVQSLWYRAPEVALNFPYTPKVDSWGVGCLLVEMFSGQALFRVHTIDQLLDKVEAMAGFTMMRDAYEEEVAWRSTGRPLFNEHGSIYSPEREPDQDSPLSSRFYVSLGTDPDLKDLGLRLLHPNPSKRISCEEALYHPFLSALTIADVQNFARTPILGKAEDLSLETPMQPEVSSLGTMESGP